MCHLCDINMPATKYVYIPEQGKEWTGYEYRIPVDSQVYNLMLLELDGVAESFKVTSQRLNEKTIVLMLGIKTMTITISNKAH